MLAGFGLFAPASTPGQIFWVLASKSTLSSALRLSVPITFAALGGIFSEKAGVVNIGLEGLLIISAFTAVIGADGHRIAVARVPHGIVASTLLAGGSLVAPSSAPTTPIAGRGRLIASDCAVRLAVFYGGPNTSSVGTCDAITVPTLAEIPFFGALFDASPAVYIMLLAVAASWYVLNRTAFGRWVRAAGENPKALDTAGVDVTRVRYAAVLLSGVLAGMGGAALSLGLGQFVGNNQTMVNGKGFIAIVAYLFGNYNPVGALRSTTLFAGLDAVQLRLQTAESRRPRLADPDDSVRRRHRRARSGRQDPPAGSRR